MHTWLPGEEWVSGHWVPFEEQALKRALRLRGRGLEAYLYNDHHTPADGKARFHHGTHPAWWPSTRAQRRVNDRRVERVRRGLHRSCWRRPPRWG